MAFVTMGAGTGTTRAAPPQPQRAAQSPTVAIVDGGRFAGQTTPEGARRDGLTVVDLSDDWLAQVFSEVSGKPQPLRPYLIDLANGRIRGGNAYARPREDRHFESFGIFPSLNLLRRRLTDRKRHSCHDRVADKALASMAPKSVILPEEPEKTANPQETVAATPAPIEKAQPKPLSPAAQRAVIAMQAHLRCENLLPHKAKRGRTPAYRSVKRGESSGCHRLHNHLALRLAGFLIQHRPHVRQGLVPEDYVRRLQYQGQEVALASENKGYRFELTPPVPVTVLDGDIRGNAKNVKSLVPLTVVP